MSSFSRNIALSAPGGQNRAATSGSCADITNVTRIAGYHEGGKQFRFNPRRLTHSISMS